MCHRVDPMQDIGLLSVAFELLDVHKEIDCDILLIRPSEYVAEGALTADILRIKSERGTVMYFG